MYGCNELNKRIGKILEVILHLKLEVLKKMR